MKNDNIKFKNNKINFEIHKINFKKYISSKLDKFLIYFNRIAFCNIELENNRELKYLDIYLNIILTYDKFTELCIILSSLNNYEYTNIKMKNIETNEIIYDIFPKDNKPTDKNKSVIKRNFKILF